MILLGVIAAGYVVLGIAWCVGSVAQSMELFTGACAGLFLWTLFSMAMLIARQAGAM